MQEQLVHVIDREGLVWRIVRDGGMAVRGHFNGVESIGIETLRGTRGPLVEVETWLTGLTVERLAEALPVHRYCSPVYPREHEACLATARATLRNLARSGHNAPAEG